MPDQTVSVIVPTLNRPEYIKKCLESLRNQNLLPIEVIIVDQSNNDETRKVFETSKLDPIRKVYFFQKTKSLNLARNNGIRSASNAAYICFVDDDGQLAPDYLERLVQRLAQSTQYAGGMGTMTNPAPSRNRFLEFFLLPHPGNGRFMCHGIPSFPHHLRQFSEVEFLSGGMSMYRAEILKQYLFDERLTGYCYGDDVDVSYRISRKYKMFFDPEAKITLVEAPPGQDPGIRFRKQWIQNMYYLLKKNVGVTPKTLAAFVWMVTGSILNDFWHFRKGAFIGNFLAIKNILRGSLDSVHD